MATSLSSSTTQIRASSASPCKDSSNSSTKAINTLLYKSSLNGPPFIRVDSKDVGMDFFVMALMTVSSVKREPIQVQELCRQYACPARRAHAPTPCRTQAVNLPEQPVQ